MSPDPILSVRRVFKAFSEVRAVNGIEFEVRPGEIFGFLGPNGAGKTTTLRMIMEIIRPDSGEILFEGSRGLDRSRVGYLPEERGLFEDAGVEETLTYLASLHGMERPRARAESRAWLERLGLSDRAGSKIGTLSKGNQQKVQLAGAIIHRPALAVLDEPFSGLDPLNQEMFLEIIRWLGDQGSAVLVSAHQLNLVERLCDRFCLISRGRGLLDGTLEEIRRKAAGGAGEVLAVELRSARPKAARASDVKPVLEQAARDAAYRLSDGPDGAILVEASLPPEADLSPILSALSQRFAISSVKMRPLSLHEIYVRSVGEDHAIGAGHEAAARA